MSDSRTTSWRGLCCRCPQEHTDRLTRFNIGSIVSFFIVPYFTDWAGRKWPIFVGCLIMIGGGLISTLAPDWKGRRSRDQIPQVREADVTAVYLAGRMVLGFGNSFSQVSRYTFPTDGHVTSLLTPTSFM